MFPSIPEFIASHQEVKKEDDDLLEFLTKLNHAIQLSKIVRSHKRDQNQCNYCIKQHSIGIPHNICLKQYSELQVLSDLIEEEGALFEICEWARKNVQAQTQNESTTQKMKAMNCIIAGNLEQAMRFMTEEEQQIFSSLRPFGSNATFEFDFMKINYGNLNWYQTLYTLNQYNTDNLLYIWAGCKPINDAQDYYLYLWFNLRAMLVSRVLLSYKEFQKEQKQIINFGIHKEIKQEFQQYDFFQSVNFQENWIYQSLIGKVNKLQLQIIKHITQDDQEIEMDDLINMITQYKSKKVVAFCLFQIGLLMIQLNMNRQLNKIIDLYDHSDINYILYLLQYCEDIDFINQTLKQLIDKRKDFEVTIQKITQFNIDKKIVQEQIIFFSQNHPNLINQFKDLLDSDNIKKILLHLLNDPDLNKEALLTFIVKYPQCFAPNLINILQIYYQSHIDGMIQQFQQSDDFWQQKFLLKMLNLDLSDAQFDQLLNILKNRNYMLTKPLLALIAKRFGKKQEFMKLLFQ